MFYKIKEILRINWIKTLAFNCRTFNVSTAIYLPVLIYGKCYYKTHKGAIQISNLRRGMMIIGRIPNSYIYGELSVYPSVVRILGTVVLKGNEGRVQLGGGNKLVVGQKATLVFGEDVSLGQNSTICSAKYLEFGNHVSVSWDCQFYDTDFHYIIAPDNKIRSNTRDVYIGDHVWIGNRVSIQKGSVPSNSIVGANSVVMHDYRNEKSGIYVGSPARLLKSGYRRIFGKSYEKIINQYFSDHSDMDCFDASNLTALEHIIN